MEEFGFVSRLDTVQAVVVRFRLQRLERVIAQRRRNAEIYRATLDRGWIYIPEDRNEAFDTYHTFVVQVDRRDELKAYLAANGIGTAIHYPIPIHLQPAARSLGYREGDFPVTETQAKRILTLPVNPSLEADDVRFVADRVNQFFSRTQA